MPNYNNETVDFDGELKDETDKAWIIVIDGEDYVCPRSVCEWHGSKNQVDGYVTMPMWLATERGLA